MQACKSGNSFRLRVANLPAGDYLVAVDGSILNGLIVALTGADPVQQGSFTLTTQAFPAGFPAAAACEAAETITVPNIGAAPFTSTIAKAELSANELEGTCGGAGDEKVLTFTAPETATLTIATGDPAGGTTYDTVVYVRQGDCNSEAATDEVGCNDDGGANVGPSSVDVNVVAGTTYFIVVAAFGAVDAGSSTLLTITSKAVAPPPTPTP